MVDQNDEVVDMDELGKTQDVHIDEESEKEPDSTIGEDTEIEEDSDKEPDSEIADI